MRVFLLFSFLALIACERPNENGNINEGQRIKIEGSNALRSDYIQSVELNSATASVGEYGTDRFDKKVASKCDENVTIQGVEFWTENKNGFVDAQLHCKDENEIVSLSDFQVKNPNRQFSGSLVCPAEHNFVGIQLKGEYDFGVTDKNSDKLVCYNKDIVSYGMTKSAEWISYFRLADTESSKLHDSLTLLEANSRIGLCGDLGEFEKSRWLGAVNARVYCETPKKEVYGIEGNDKVLPEHGVAWTRPVLCRGDEKIVGLSFNVLYGSGITGLDVICE